MRRYLPILLLITLVMGCNRESFDLEQSTLIPIVVATHSQSGDSMLSEGVALALLGSSFDKSKEYQFSLSSPSETYVWERMVAPFSSNDLLYVGSNDLLLPPDETLEGGLWQVELFLPDGRQRSQEIEFTPSRATLDEALFKVSLLPPLEWEASDKGWHIDPYEGEWLYTLYGPTKVNSFRGEVVVDAKTKGETAAIVALHYDEGSHLFYVVRTLFD